MDFAINNLDVRPNYGLEIEDASALLGHGDRKNSDSFDYKDENGEYIDLSDPRFEDLEVTLKCCIIADNRADFWLKRNALFTELRKPGYSSLTVADHAMTYQVYFKKSGNWKKLNELDNGGKTAIMFDLTIKVKFL